MPTLDFESDRFLQLLTDALRAGPGSPEWHEAVTALKGNGTSHGDDYQLLLSARQNLESGKDYRSVRAGPGFTRKLNDALEDESLSEKKNPIAPTTGIVAIVSALLILTAAAVLCYLLFPNGVPTAAIEKLSNTYFVPSMLDVNFDSSLPDTLRPFGTLQLDSQQGLHPANLPASILSSGGVVWTQSIPPDQPIAIEASLRINRPTDDLIAEVFIADSSDFTHQLRWIYQSSQTKVVAPSGADQATIQVNRDFHGTIPLRIAINRQAAIVEQSGRQIWAGTNGLDDSRPRTIGLRFLKTGDDKNPDPAMAFTSLKVSKPSAAE